MDKEIMRSKKANNAFALAFVAGILVLVNGLGLGVVAAWYPGIMPTMPGTSGNDPAVLYTLSALGIALGFIVLLGAVLLRIKPAKSKVWGIMVIIFSLPSVIMGGGFIVGFIMGIVGGKLAYSSNTPRPPKNNARFLKES